MIMAAETDRLTGKLLPIRAQGLGDVQNTKRLSHLAALSVFLIALGVAAAFVMRRPAGADFEVHPAGAVEALDPLSSSREENRHCDNGRYSKRTLKKAYEMPFAALFKDCRGQKKFEASDVIKVGDDFYAVCDSSWAISKFGSALLPFAETNVQIGDPERVKNEDSGYEGIVHSDGIFYVVRESVLHTSNATKRTKQAYYAIVEELQISVDNYTVTGQCRSEFEFEGDSKGFEGAIGVKDLRNRLTILGLCEGNHCSEKDKGDRGNGRLVAMQKTLAHDGSCMWKTLKMIDIPVSADFLDYSAITVDEKGRVAISSQEDSKIWVGRLVGLQENGLYDLEKLALLDSEEGKPEVYHFPMNDDCEVVYCNIEGIHWLDENMIVAVSDKMKSKGKQPFRCFDKDQSVHAFVFP